MTLAPKREDYALLTGAGRFADDVRLSSPLYVAFVRAQMGVGAIRELDLSPALGPAGVVAIHAGADVAHLGDLGVNPVLPILHKTKFEVLANDHVKAIGQPVAAVLADSPERAGDAASEVFVDIETQNPSTAIVARKSWCAGDPDQVFQDADHVVTCTVQHPRLAPSPMEPRTISIAYDGDTDCVTVWHSTQTPHRTRSELAGILGVDQSRIRVIAKHVGGAFGMKASLYPEEAFAVWAAFHHKRDVKWTATRSEEFLSATHGRGLRSTGSLAFDRNGVFLALRAEIQTPIGPWLPNSGLIPAWNAGRILPSGYRIENLDITTTARKDGRGPIGIYRGAGRPEANMLMERLVDKAAAKLGHDPIDLRQKNLLRSQDLPHATLIGNTLDSGDYPKSLRLLAERTDYQGLIAKRNKRRLNGELVGIGTVFCVEPSGSGWESAQVTRNADGSVLVASGSSSQGHARETAYAKIAAKAFGTDPSRVTVVLADTDQTPPGIGAVASRATAIGGSAVLKACRQIVARQSEGIALPITADVIYENEGQAWGYGAYLALVSICQDTGKPTLEYAACVDDAGTLVCPDLVAGQITGGFAQGFGEAMLEQIIYDDDGQLLTGSFMDYAIARATDLPPLGIHKIETPSPMNILGAKGVGEAGTIGAPAAILNAALDALAPLGVADLQMPLSAHRIWQTMQAAKQGTD